MPHEYGENMEWILRETEKILLYWESETVSWNIWNA